MAIEQAQPRRHPDLFTPEDAAAYLYLESVRSLDTLRSEYGLLGVRVGKTFMYHRKDLDALACRMFKLDGPGVATVGAAPKLKLSGGRA